MPFSKKKKGIQHTKSSCPSLSLNIGCPNHTTAIPSQLSIEPTLNNPPVCLTSTPNSLLDCYEKECPCKEGRFTSHKSLSPFSLSLCNRQYCVPTFFIPQSILQCNSLETTKIHMLYLYQVSKRIYKHMTLNKHSP